MLYGKHTMLLHPMSLHMVLLSYVRPSARCSCRPFVLLQPIVFSKPKRVASPHHHYAPCRLLDLSCQVYERLELHYCFFIVLQRVGHSLAKFFNCPHQKVAIKLFFHPLTISMYTLCGLGPGLCVRVPFFGGWPGHYSNTSPTACWSGCG
jgi:hypothetical protein